MICPICGAANLRTESITERFSYNERNIDVDDYVIHVCDGCKEAIVDQDVLNRSGRILKEHYEL